MEVEGGRATHSMFTHLRLGSTHQKEAAFFFSFEGRLQALQISKPLFLNLYSVEDMAIEEGSITKQI